MWSFVGKISIGVMVFCAGVLVGSKSKESEINKKTDSDKPVSDDG